MKRLMMVVLLGMMLVGTAESRAEGVGLGLKAGVNFSQPQTDRPGVTTESRAGLMAGLALTFPLSPTNAIFLRTEGLYVARDWKEKGNVWRGQPLRYERLVKTDELVFAPLLVMRFAPGGAVNPFLELGPEIGVTLSHEAKNEIDDVSRLSELQEIEDWGRTNYNLNFGGGLVFPAGAGEVLLEARYNLGLSDYDLEDGDIVARTRGVQFLLGFNFNAPGVVKKNKDDGEDEEEDIDIQIQNKNENEDDDD